MNSSALTSERRTRFCPSRLIRVMKLTCPSIERNTRSRFAANATLISTLHDPSGRRAAIERGDPDLQRPIGGGVVTATSVSSRDTCVIDNREIRQHAVALLRGKIHDSQLDHARCRRHAATGSTTACRPARRWVSTRILRKTAGVHRSPNAATASSGGFRSRSQAIARQAQSPPLLPPRRGRT